MLFPSVSVPGELTRIALSDVHAGDDLPNVNALLSTDDPTAYADAPESTPRAVPLLTEHALNTFTRPGLRGFRITVDDAEDEASAADFAALMQLGGGWTPRFAIAQEPEVSDRRLAYRAVDESAGLELGTELESLAGGSLRIRHTLTNRADSPYVVQGLDVSVPLADNQTELLDFTGRHERERQPQRHTIADGIWSREFRWGKTGFEGPLFVAGTPGFDFAHGSVLMVQPAWSGNNELYVQRDMAQIATVSAGELLEPGEIVLRQGESYATPWIMVTASNSGLDGAAASLHQWERSLPAHPRRQPVVLNVWEGVMFDHNLDTLLEIARRAAAIGVERYVLDDGWFHLRRDDHAGLGDWWVDPDVWPEGLHPLVDFVHEQGMQFGLWFEPEMVNPDSDLYREHPDWVLRRLGPRFSSVTSSCSTLPILKHSIMCIAPFTMCCPNTASITSSGTTTGTCLRRARTFMGERRRSITRPWPITVCWTSSALISLISNGNPAHPAAAASILALSNTYSAAGLRT